MDFSQLENFILDRLLLRSFPSIAIAVVEGDKIVYANAFGLRDIENVLVATPKTLYGVGSVTKSFTALSIMLLEAEGKLNVDDPITKYLELRFKHPLGNITIHHLLTHSSGIPALAYAEALIDGLVGARGAWLPLTKKDDVLAFMSSDMEKWVSHKPGERFFYLNEGYVLLGKIIEKVSKKSYKEFVRDKILKPLGMKRSCFDKVEVEKLGNWAEPYIRNKEGSFIRSRFPFGISADGGLISTVLDLAKYIRLYLGKGTYNGKEIIDSSYIEKMMECHIREPYENVRECYGYGLSSRDFLNYNLVGHSGSVLVHTAYIGFIPDKKLGVAVLANSSGYPLSLIGEYALAIALGEDPNKLESIRRENILSSLVGTYATYKKTMILEVKRNGDFLFVVDKARYWESITVLVPVLERLKEDKAEFYTVSRGRRLPVEFVKEDDTWTLYLERYKLRKIS